MTPELVYSPHAFRVSTEATPQMLPIFSPEGRYFYLITPSPAAPTAKKRYLHGVVKNFKDKKATKITVTYSRQTAMKFDNLRLAESYADFLSTFDHDYDFWIVLEPDGYKEEALTRKTAFQSLADSKV